MILCSDCNQNPIKARGLCSSCYEKARRAGKFGAKKCLSCGEIRSTAGRGLCDLCYQRQRNSGDITQFSTRGDEIVKLSVELGGMYDSGLTVEEISSKTGIPKTSVWHILESGGIPKRQAKIREYLRIPLNEKVFDTIDSEDKAYWLGFLYADGSTDRFRVIITLSTRDENHLEKFLSFTESDSTIKRWDRSPMSPMSTIMLSNVYLASRLRDLGVIPRRTNLRATLSNLPAYLERDFIRGYFDGDGWVCKDIKNPYAGFTGRLDIITWVEQAIAKDLNLRRRSPKKNKSSYEIRYDGKGIVSSIGQWFYRDASVFLERKHKLFSQWIQL